MGSVSRHRLWCQHVFIATILNLLQISLGSPVNFYNPSIAHFQSHRNQRNLPCVVLRTGMEGTCMFAIHCLRANGTHLGTCRDGYYFKSCCQIHDESPSILDHEISDNSIDQNTISHFQHHQSSPSTVTPTHRISTTMRPMKIENTIFPLNSVTISHHSPNSHSTMSSTSISDNLLTHTSSNHISTNSTATSNSDTAIFDLLSTFANSINPSTYSNDGQSTNPVIATTNHPFFYTKLPTTTPEENTKLQTFQLVQETVTTTTSFPTTIVTKNPSRRPTTVASKPTKRHRPTTTGATTKKASDDVVEITTKKPVRLTTTKSKPVTTTRRPLTTTPSKSASVHISSKRPKPTKIVTDSTTIRPLIHRNATLSTKRPATVIQSDPIITQSLPSVTKHFSTTTTPQPFSTIFYVETTKVPRPKPKPTKQIVKVPATSLDHLVELELPLTTTESIVATTQAPTTVHSSSSSLIHSSTVPMENKIEANSNGNLEINSSSESSAENEIKPIIEPTTQRPSLVTWSNIQVEKNDTNEIANTETPATPTDWILLPSVATVEPSSILPVEQSTTVKYDKTTKPLTTKIPVSSSTVKPVETTKAPLTTTKTTVTTTTTEKFSTTTLPTSSKTTTTKAPTKAPTKATTTTLAPNKLPTSSSTQKPLESNKTELISTSTSTSSSTVPMSSTSGMPIVFPTDNTTQNPTIDENVINDNGTTTNGTATSSNLMTTKAPASSSALPSLEGIDYRQDRVAAFGTGITVDDYDISTPNFVEDQVLNDKMGLLVSKIVESLQGNFDELADVVYEEKNTTVLGDTAKPSVTKRPSPTTKKPIQKATTTKRPVSTRPGTTIARPGNTNVKPGATTKKPATRATTRKPTVASQTNTRRTTKKPTTIITKKPTVTRITTTRRPTIKPTKKQVQTTTVQQDEDVDIEDEGDEDNIGEEEEATTLGEWRLQCGVRPQVKSGRIVGGKGATFGEFPWQVLVRESTWLGLFTKNKCGGVLITKNYVMTAAHCQPGFLASLVAVFGEFDISGDLETKRSVTKNVKRVVVHREYDAATFENDLALLELESPIHYDTHIVPICMPPNMADFTGRMATVTGWGRLKYGGGVPSVLQEVQVPIIENSVCQEMFHTAGHNKKILPSFLCAGYANGQKILVRRKTYSYKGDSGGPLVLQRSDGRWELAGTVSHGIKCAAPYLPGVYMRTTYYKPWLESVTGVH